MDTIPQTLRPGSVSVGQRVYLRQRGHDIVGTISALYDDPTRAEVQYLHPEGGNGTVRLGHTVRTDAYVVHLYDVAARAAYLHTHASRSPVDGAWRWDSNGSCVPDDYLASTDAPQAERDLTTEARRAELAQLVAHMRATEPAQPDAEQLAEMRAAFGPGTTVVNVLTGRTTQL